MMAAARIVRNRTAARVTLIDSKPQFVQRIRLHEILAGRTPKTLAYAPLLEKRGVRFVQARIEALDPAARRVVAHGMEGSRIEIGYDTLILAMGSATALDVPGVAEHAVRLDDPTVLHNLHEQLFSPLPGKGRRELGEGPGVRALRILVAGGGLTGIETATELAERFPKLQVTLATRGRFAEGFSQLGAAHLRRRLAELGVALQEEAEITALEPGQAGLAGGGSLPFDRCFWCGGFAAPTLARDAGLPVDVYGRVRTDVELRVLGHPEIFAAGDAAAAPAAGAPAIRMGCVSALPMGAQAGENVVRRLHGEEPAPFDMAFQIRCISLGRKDGLVQFVEGDDTPVEKIWTRRRAAFVKEMICRLTLFTVRWELRAGLRLYRWPQRKPSLIQSADGGATGAARRLSG
jgi:NADH dehydrogenase FAD-containing subunit